MKKIILIIILIASIASIQAQNYLINFVATGSASILDSVKIENLTQSTSLTIHGGDILHLLGQVGVNNENNLGNEISISPNPMIDQSIISFSTKKAGYYTMAIFDLNGNIVYQNSESTNQGAQKYLISGLQKGLYIIKIQGDNYTFSSKLVCFNNSKHCCPIKKIKEKEA